MGIVRLLPLLFIPLFLWQPQVAAAIVLFVFAAHMFIKLMQSIR